MITVAELLFQDDRFEVAQCWRHVFEALPKANEFVLHRLLAETGVEQPRLEGVACSICRTRSCRPGADRTHALGDAQHIRRKPTSRASSLKNLWRAKYHTARDRRALYQLIHRSAARRLAARATYHREYPGQSQRARSGRAFRTDRARRRRRARADRAARRRRLSIAAASRMAKMLRLFG